MTTHTTVIFSFRCIKLAKLIAQLILLYSIKCCVNFLSYLLIISFIDLLYLIFFTFHFSLNLNFESPFQRTIHALHIDFHQKNLSVHVCWLTQYRFINGTFLLQKTF